MESEQRPPLPRQPGCLSVRASSSRASAPQLPPAPGPLASGPLASFPFHTAHKSLAPSLDCLSSLALSGPPCLPVSVSRSPPHHMAAERGGRGAGSKQRGCGVSGPACLRQPPAEGPAAAQRAPCAQQRGPGPRPETLPGPLSSPSLRFPFSFLFIFSSSVPKSY